MIKVTLLYSLHRHLFKHSTLLRTMSSMASGTNSETVLSKDEVSRYSRQLLLPEIGADGQRKLKSTSILIVGCGGLGCPSGLYLAAAGLGKIGLVDNDAVERSNLHRQVLHTESGVGTNKTDSAMKALSALNSNVDLVAHQVRLNRDNALHIVKQYDIVLDATDNAMARYLLSDVCVIAKKPLVSGSALRFDGQMTVYNHDNSPCYRCLFPVPPPPGTVTNCNDGGVLGVVPGIIGSLQALEAIKIALGHKSSYAGQMLLFDGLRGQFRNVKIRGKRADCVSCGDNPTIGLELMDYEAFCGNAACAASANVKILAENERISCQQYKYILDDQISHLLIDVRPKLQADITKLDNSINIPLDELIKGNGLQQLQQLIDEKDVDQVYVMCRRGNASQKAVRFIKDALPGQSKLLIKDVEGGIERWAQDIDLSLPMY